MEGERMSESDRALALLAGADEDAIKAEIAAMEERLAWLRPLAWMAGLARSLGQPPRIAPAEPPSEEAPSRPAPSAGPASGGAKPRTKPAPEASAASDDDEAMRRKLLALLAGGPMPAAEARKRLGLVPFGARPEWMRHPWFDERRLPNRTLTLSLSAAGRAALAADGKAAGPAAPPAAGTPIPGKSTSRARVLRMLASAVHTEDELRSRLGLDDGLPLPLEGDPWFFGAKEGDEMTWRLSAQGREALSEGAGRIGEGAA